MLNETVKIPVAIYFDLENIDKSFNVEKLINSISESLKDMGTPIFAIKLACGKKSAIDNFEEKLNDLNFTIQDTPHVSKSTLKNRADLILSLSAFESFHLNNPEIELYIFITSDTDFTVIADKLRKYGRNVWLVIKKEYSTKKLFCSSADKILAIEDFSDKKSSDEEKNESNPQEEIVKKIIEHYKTLPGKKPTKEKTLRASISRFITNTFTDLKEPDKKEEVKNKVLNSDEMKSIFSFLKDSHNNDISNQKVPLGISFCNNNEQ
ncbi:MAG: NYN domain-containing protein [Treponema sp.]|nr:NYN domain-containing protein [Treponema sp.]